MDDEAGQCDGTSGREACVAFPSASCWRTSQKTTFIPNISAKTPTWVTRIGRRGEQQPEERGKLDRVAGRPAILFCHTRRCRLLDRALHVPLWHSSSYPAHANRTRAAVSSQCCAVRRGASIASVPNAVVHLRRLVEQPAVERNDFGYCLLLQNRDACVPACDRWW